MGHHQATGNQRLSQVDALRGVAALAVVLFHFTARFVDLYFPGYVPIIKATYGYLGVNLFFIISGFVIFMTLQRTEQAMDFVVSRFSRLFPSYWAAIILTSVITHWLGLPGKLIGLSPTLANFFMVHGIFGVPHVDGAYWTLEVEMLFYLGMFTMFRLRWLQHIHWALLFFLSLRLLYVLMAQAFGIDLPWIAYRLLILQYIPWFALGICVFQFTRRQPHVANMPAILTAAAAVLTLVVAESWVIGALAITFASLAYAAASGRLRLFDTRVFLWLGSISYPLYLVHENIGWSIQLQVLASGWPFWISVVLALVVALAMATALTRWIEQPALLWIRARYRDRKQALVA